ncbi:hypothetical protein DPMN_129163 [Dreissena polymorpha]|uniref:Uncharacterized protein n=1 Tax=Dreissena polymorpha TaxID=45954 RepID=A0A9D4H4E0_DREPO|nr:hypothetical protein DPMN_129163 [Dreissena polymorpha]
MADRSVKMAQMKSAVLQSPQCVRPVTSSVQPCEASRSVSTWPCSVMATLTVPMALMKKIVLDALRTPLSVRVMANVFLR